MPDQTHLQELPSEEKGSQDSRKTASAQSALLGTLKHKLTTYISKRQEKEDEWTIALRQYNGLPDELDDKKQVAMGSGRSSTLPTVNITRPKTNIAVSRLQDIQFPVGGDFNFKIDPTPIPELTTLQKEVTPMPGTEGQTTIGDAAYETLRRAQEAAGRMQSHIEDRLIESRYGKHARRAMMQMGVLGTGVLKAPVMTHKRSKKYTAEQDQYGKTVQIMSYSGVTTPTVQWVDILHWFPDPSARDPDSIRDCFEIHPMTDVELRELAYNPAFIEDNIRKALEDGPDLSSVAKSHLLSIIGKTDDQLDRRFFVAEYNGPLDKSVLVELGELSEEEAADPLVIPYGEIWFVGDNIIRVSISPIDGMDRIPYHVCTWDDDPASVFGHGIPYLMRHAARVVNSSWMMLLDNAGLTAGPQIVINKEMITPANPSEGWSIKPMKMWFMTEYGGDVKEAIQFVNVPTQQESIASIIELALHFADLESSLPAIQQGELPSGNNTFGGMAMIMSATHIIQQAISEKWDDYINIPIVNTLYHYEMQYGEDESAKGDYEVQTGGATERIDKQIRAQDIERIIGMAGTQPELLMHIDTGQAFREWVRTTRVGNILKPIEQVEAEQQAAAENAQPDPASISAQAAMLQAQAAVDRVKLDERMRAAELNLKAQVEEASIDASNREIVARERESAIRLQVAQMNRENILMQLASQEKLSMADLAAKLNTAVMTEETKRLSKQADLDKFNTEIKIKREMGEGI